MILSVTLNPCVDYTLFVEELKVSDTNRVQRQEVDAGGKGVNLSRIVAELGGDTVASGFLGGDPGKFILRVLAEQGVRSDFVSIEGETRRNFNVETTAVDMPPTTLNSRGPEISHAEWDQLRTLVVTLAQEASWVALGGSLPPGVPTSGFADLIGLLRTTPARILLDADGEAMRLGLEAKPDMIKPNAKEAGRLLGREIVTTDEACIAAQQLLERVATGGTVILSRGEDGAVLAHGNECWIGESPEVDAKSTIGSGDSLLGGYLCSLDLGRSTDEAFRWGLAAGAATALTDGSGIGRRETVEELLPKAVVRV